MAAMKQIKASSRHPTIQANPLSPDPTPPHVINPLEHPVNGKKKKKKKSKAKSSVEPDVQGPQTDEDVLPLDVSNSHQITNRTTTTSIFPASRCTGLSPELESVHLSASVAAVTRLDSTAAAQEELLATAHNLYRSMDTDTIPDDEDYWAALPTHIKNFVKMTYSNSTNPNINASERSKAQSVLAIAHQMIQSGAEKVGPRGVGGQSPGAFPAFPFDPAILSDPAFLAMEQTFATGGSHPPAPGQPPRGPLPHPNVVLLNEYNNDEHHDYDYSEDEIEEHEHEHEPEHDHRGAFVGYEYKVGSTKTNNATSDVGKKKSKKKKKKGSAVTMNNTVATQQQPFTSRPAPPSNPPVPSSRAAGKQPMSYNTNPSLPLATAQNVQSAKAVSNTHHPSPASSQTSHGKTHTATAIATNNNTAFSTSPQSKLWSTNSSEERERIKEFWLGLSEEERRALVKVEKEAVLKKMKEQQKHSCSCAVCGRKRHAIEEELEVLYDAYYEELEQYAIHQQQYVSSGGTIPPPPGPGPFPGSVELDKNGTLVGGPHHHRHHRHHDQHHNRVTNALTGETATPQHHHLHPHLARNGNNNNTNSDFSTLRKGGVNVDGDATISINVNARRGPESEFEDEDGEDEYEEDEEDEDDDEDDEDDEDENEEGDDVEDDEHEPSEKKLLVSRRGAGLPEDGGGLTDAHPTNPNVHNNATLNGVKPTNNAVAASTNTSIAVRGGGDDVFNFRSGLSVTGVVNSSSTVAAAASSGNILTVADDLLKNDGRKFLEMMEQLAERRMQREEEAAAEVGKDSDGEEEEEEEEEEEDGDEEEDDDDDEEEEEEVMTEEQRMEEGRRMFSIFAARMFEQRVLQSYREKVAQERQQEILRELENEDKAAQEREAKKQKENQKKKAKKLLQKQAKEEEKRQREAEKAAEELASKAKQQAHEGEMKKKREEERLRRETVRKLQDEERARKEDERRKRLAEEKERLAEQERKRKEREERLKVERKEREEKERRAKEEKEARFVAEKAAAIARREQLEKEEREKRVQKEAEERKGREAKERLLREQQRVSASTSTTNVVVVLSPQHNSGKAKAPTSPRGANINVLGAPSRISIPPATAPKKILTKPPVTPVTASSAASLNVLPSSFQPAMPSGIINYPPVSTTVSMMQAPSVPSSSSRIPRSPQRPSITTQTLAPNMASPQPQHPIPSSVSSSQIQSPGASHTPVSIPSFHQGFTSPSGASGISSTMTHPGYSVTPFVNGLPTPPFIPYGPPPGIPPPPSMSRGGFNNPAFESFRPLGGGGGNGSSAVPPSATGPPPKGLLNSPGSPISMFSPPAAPGSSSTGHHLRRGSVQERPMFGAVQRPVGPLAPIARPQTLKDDAEKAASPNMKSSSSTSTPAPEPVLGSSALVADDDEPIIVQHRRVITAPLGWGMPQPEPLNSRTGWPNAGSQSLPFGTPTRTPNGMWGASSSLGPDPWQQSGPFPQHSSFPPAFVNSPPPGNS